MSRLRLATAVVLAGACLAGCGDGSGGCDFPESEEVLANGDSQGVEVTVRRGHLLDVLAAGWTYSVFRRVGQAPGAGTWPPDPTVQVPDGTYRGTVTARPGRILVLTGVADARFVLHPVGCD
jgi:hypothetical protein